MQKLVLVALADNASDPSGKAWPSKEEIIRKTGLAQASVYRALIVLKERGLVVEADDEKGRPAFWLSHGENPFSQSESGNSQSENGTTYKEPSKNRNGKVDPQTEQRLFELWRDATGRDESRTKFTDGRRRSLRARLKEYSAEEIAQAIRNCAADDWHVENGHTDLSLICRNGEKLERFRDMGGGGEDAAWEAFLS